MGSGCQLDSTYPELATLIVFLIYLFLGAIAAIWSFIVVRSRTGEWSRLSFNKKIRTWFKALWAKRSCYFPAVTHLVDQASDFGVLVQFYELYKLEEEHGEDYCPG